jgi:hypothetical protein
MMRAPAGAHLPAPNRAGEQAAVGSLAPVVRCYLRSAALRCIMEHSLPRESGRQPHQ